MRFAPLLLVVLIAGCPFGGLGNFTSTGQTQPTVDVILTFAGTLTAKQTTIAQRSGEAAETEQADLSGPVEAQFNGDGLPLWNGMEIVEGMERTITLGNLTFDATATGVTQNGQESIVDYTLTGLITHDGIPLRVNGAGQDRFTPRLDNQMHYVWAASLEHSSSDLYLTVDFDGSGNLQLVEN